MNIKDELERTYSVAFLILLTLVLSAIVVAVSCEHSRMTRRKDLLTHMVPYCRAELARQLRNQRECNYWAYRGVTSVYYAELLEKAAYLGGYEEDN